MGAQAELGGLEGVRLGHGLLGTVEAIEDELAEEAEAQWPCLRNAAAKKNSPGFTTGFGLPRGA